MKIVDTFTATIYVGLKEENGLSHAIEEAQTICQEYCDKIGLCVTLTPTRFIYTNGWENGCIIGLINYPRFPDTPDNIKDKAIELSEILLKEFNQYKVSLVCADKTYMIEQ